MAFVIYIKLNLLTAVTNSGMGTWDSGTQEHGTWGRGDVGLGNDATSPCDLLQGLVP